MLALRGGTGEGVLGGPVAVFGASAIAFLALYFLPWNPIYPGILSMFVGAVDALKNQRESAA